MVEPAIERRSADSSLVVGVVESRSRMASCHAGSIRVGALRFDVGVEIVADKNAGSSVVVAPQTSGVGCRGAGGVATAAGQHALSDADIRVVGDRSRCGVERTLSHTSFGGGIAPSALNCAAAVA